MLVIPSLCSLGKLMELCPSRKQLHSLLSWLSSDLQQIQKAYASGYSLLFSPQYNSHSLMHFVVESLINVSLCSGWRGGGLLEEAEKICLHSYHPLYLMYVWVKPKVIGTTLVNLQIIRSMLSHSSVIFPFILKDSELYPHTVSMPSPTLWLGFQWGKGKRHATTLASGQSSSPSFPWSCSIWEEMKSTFGGAEDVACSDRIQMRRTECTKLSKGLGREDSRTAKSLGNESGDYTWNRT